MKSCSNVRPIITSTSANLTQIQQPSLVWRSIPVTFFDSFFSIRFDFATIPQDMNNLKTERY